MHYKLIIVRCLELFLRQISINRDFLYVMPFSVFEVHWCLLTFCNFKFKAYEIKSSRTVCRFVYVKGGVHMWV